MSTIKPIREDLVVGTRWNYIPSSHKYSPFVDVAIPVYTIYRAENNYISFRDTRGSTHRYTIPDFIHNFVQVKSSEENTIYQIKAILSILKFHPSDIKTLEKLLIDLEI